MKHTRVTQSFKETRICKQSVDSMSIEIILHPKFFVFGRSSPEGEWMHTQPKYNPCFHCLFVLPGVGAAVCKSLKPRQRCMHIERSSGTQHVTGTVSNEATSDMGSKG